MIKMKWNQSDNWPYMLHMHIHTHTPHSHTAAVSNLIQYSVDPTGKHNKETKEWKQNADDSADNVA